MDIDTPIIERLTQAAERTDKLQEEYSVTVQKVISELGDDLRMTRDFARAATMLGSSDLPPERNVDVLYIASLSKGMAEADNIFDIATDLFKSGKVKCISFNGSDGEGMRDPRPGTAWPGKKFFIEELTARGVPPDLLFPTGPGLHSRQETDQFIRLAQVQGWRTAGILSISYHIRCIMGLIKGMQLQGYHIDAWWIGHPTKWFQPVMASQGAELSLPFDECLKDLSKVIAYVRKGDLCTFTELFEYIKQLPDQKAIRDVETQRQAITPA